jgi:hypothetical protein
VAGLHVPESQSLGTAQVWPAVHGLQSPPPQSLSVSCPSIIMSMHSGLHEHWMVPLHPLERLPH